MLELKNVSKYYNGAYVSLGLRNINAKFYKNEIVAIVGESGSGKSTFLNVISFMDTYEEGEILFNSNPTSYFNKADMDLFRKNHIQYIPQNYNIIEAYTVLENVMMPLILKNMDLEEAKSKAIEIIEKVGLKNRINNKGVQLSGGEKQRCVIARALATDCQILACDEPTGNLDSETGLEIMKLIKEISKDKLVFIVTHNYDQVKDIATRKITMFDGEIKDDKIIKPIPESIESTEFKMEEKKIDFRHFLKLMKSHIISTPHKLILSLIVSTIFFLCALFFSLECNKTYQSLKYTDDEKYVNNIDNRLVVYNKDHSLIDTNIIDKIKGEKYYNAFYEDMELNFNTVKTANYTSGSYSKHYPADTTNELGSLPLTDDDMYLIVPKEKLEKIINMFENSIGDKIKFDSYFLADLNLKLCGIGSSEDISNTIIYTKVDLSKYISRLYLVDLDVTYERENEIIYVDYTTTKKDRSDVIIVGPKEEWNDIYVTIKHMYKVKLNNYDISYDETNISETFGISLVLSTEFKFDEIYEAVIYADDPDGATKSLIDAGFEVDRPGKNGIDYESKDYTRFLILLGVSIASVGVALIISNVIISKIMDSKSREYTILRSLGLLSSDMKKLAASEILSILLFSLISSILIMLILNFVGVEFLKLFGYFNIIITLLIVIVFGVAFIRIYTKVNRKLLKKSVVQILNSEVLRK